MLPWTRNLKCRGVKGMGLESDIFVEMPIS